MMIKAIPMTSAQPDTGTAARYPVEDLNMELLAQARFTLVEIATSETN